MSHFLLLIAVLSATMALLSHMCFVARASASAAFAIRNYATLVDRKHGVITAESAERQCVGLSWRERRLAAFLSDQLRTYNLGHKLYTVPGELILGSRASGLGDAPAIIDTTRHIFGVNLTELHAYEAKYFDRVL